MPFRLLNASEGETIEALGETLVPGARQAGIAHFIDQQISVPAEEALLRGAHLQRASAVCEFLSRRASARSTAPARRSTGRKFAALSTTDQREFRRQHAPEQDRRLAGPAAAFVYTILRSDAVDVVYGTMEGYAALGIPYQAHIAPTKRW